MTTVSWAVFSLLHDDTGKPLVSSLRLRSAIAGAVLWELAEAGRIELMPRTWGRPARVRAEADVLSGRSIEDHAVALVQVRGNPRVTSVIGKLAPYARDAVADEIVVRNAEVNGADGPGVGWTGAPVLALPRSRRAPRSPVLGDSAALKLRFHQLLVRGTVLPTTHDAAVISILWASGGLGKVLPESNARHAQRRVAEFRANDWIADAVWRRTRQLLGSGVLGFSIELLGSFH